MPVSVLRTPSVQVLVHRTASGFLSAALPSLFRRESAANTILPPALRLLAIERAMALDAEGCPRSTKISYNHSRGHLWLTCWSIQEGKVPVLEMVLSCTGSTLGDCPIFLYSSLPPSKIAPTLLEACIAALATQLSSLVSAMRVFSVFGHTLLAEEFATQWAAITGVARECEPLYAATFTYATKESLTSSNPLTPGECMRRATADDLPAIAQLCQEFAETSIYYPLSYEKSLREAKELVERRQVWVYETYNGQIASIVAAARTSPHVATITKVFTTALWRKQGCAERLVRKVAQELFNAGKRRVVLYVGHGNPAGKVYNRVGFVGLENKERPVDVEDWIEIGFKVACRGHW